jgi:hypothetical protein
MSELPLLAEALGYAKCLIYISDTSIGHFFRHYGRMKRQAGFLFDALSSREPVFTSLENAMGRSSFRSCVAHGSVEVQARPDAAFS